MNLDWFEHLPAECPPKNAISPQNETFYRLAANPAKNEDFFSHRKIFPSKFFRVSECIARSLSIWKTKDDCSNLLNLPANRDKVIIELSLQEEDGVVLQTTAKINHYSWWRTMNFDVTKYNVINK